MTIVRSKLKNGANLVIETDDFDFDEYDDMSAERSVFGDGRGAADKIMACGKNLIRDAVEGIQACAEEVASGIEEIKEKMRPDEVEVSLAFKLNAEAGAVITKLGGEAQMQVKLVWRNIGPKG
jgi:hypothetical protein